MKRATHRRSGQKYSGKKASLLSRRLSGLFGRRARNSLSFELLENRAMFAAVDLSDWENVPTVAGCAAIDGWVASFPEADETFVDVAISKDNDMQPATKLRDDSVVLKDYWNFIETNPQWLSEHHADGIQLCVMTPSVHLPWIDLGNPGQARAFDAWYEQTALSIVIDDPIDNGLWNCWVDDFQNPLPLPCIDFVSETSIDDSASTDEEIRLEETSDDGNLLTDFDDVAFKDEWLRWVHSQRQPRPIFVNSGEFDSTNMDTFVICIFPMVEMISDAISLETVADGVPELSIQRSFNVPNIFHSLSQLPVVSEFSSEFHTQELSEQRATLLSESVSIHRAEILAVAFSQSGFLGILASRISGVATNSSSSRAATGDGLNANPITIRHSNPAFTQARSDFRHSTREQVVVTTPKSNVSFERTVILVGSSEFKHSSRVNDTLSSLDG